MQTLSHFILLIGLFCMTASTSDSYQAANATLLDYEITGTGAPLILLHSGMKLRFIDAGLTLL